MASGTATRTLLVVHMIQNKVHDRLVDIASVQFPEGRAHHGYSPLTKGSREGYGDDHLWLELFTIIKDPSVP